MNHEPADQTKGHMGNTSVGPGTKDPVCGMDVTPSSAAGQHTYDGRTYYFCSLNCLEKFRADAKRYTVQASGQPAAALQLAPQGVFTCPMHPEVRQKAPGSCPKCGMASPRTWTWIELLLSTPVVLWGGWPFFVRGWQSMVNRSLNMFTLIGLGVFVAYFYSLAAAIFPEIFPASFRDESGQVAVYFEAAAVITTLVLLGQVLELRARSQQAQDQSRAEEELGESQERKLIGVQDAPATADLGAAGVLHLRCHPRTSATPCLMFSGTFALHAAAIHFELSMPWFTGIKGGPQSETFILIS